MNVMIIDDDENVRSPKYFSYVFKQLVGMTPLEFKKKEKIQQFYMEEKYEMDHRGL